MLNGSGIVSTSRQMAYAGTSFGKRLNKKFLSKSDKVITHTHKSHQHKPQRFCL